MALSTKVEENIAEAESALRNALALAARNERPIVCSSITEIISRLDALRKIDDFMDEVETAQKEGGQGLGPFKFL